MINPANPQKDGHAAFLESLIAAGPAAAAHLKTTLSKDAVVVPPPEPKTPQTLRSRIATLWKMGIPVIPLQPRSKKPATPHAAYDATTERAVLAQWVKTLSPNSNAAAVARYDGFWLLDDDRGTLADVYKIATGQELPYTFKVRTSRGFHYYFRHDDASRLVRYGINENSGVIETPEFKGEARCNYQYVVAPGSVHPSGAIYEIAIDTPPVVAPLALLEWLQSQYARSESLKPESEKPKSSGKSDSGFAKLFDAVGYRPLENRINALPDAGVHSEHPLERGEVVPCPMPGHKHNDYTPCFGSIKNAPELLHCCGKCGWSGDMVAACYQLDGGNATYKNMYDCARAICKEEGLEFEKFFPPKAKSEKPEASAVSATVQNPTEEAPPSPIMRPPIPEAAFYGLAGAITKKLDPCTEAHPMGILIGLLVAFGNLIGRCAYIKIEDTKHYTNEYAVNVGESSRSRKGTGRNRVNKLMEQVDPEWAKNRHISGIGSGEIIVHQVRDARTVCEIDKKTGIVRNVILPGVDDKRLLVNIGEFQGILAICHRPDTTLSVVLRNGWDSLPMANLVKTDPAKCQEPHLSLDADTTATELSDQLNQVEKHNGFANRILWVCVWRTKYLPMGGGDMDWSAEIPQLREAAEFARGLQRVYLDEQANLKWKRTIYPKLEREVPGATVGAITSRASAHTLRLALIFALLDKSDHVRVEHLDAALAVWQYCEDSVYAIFGDMLSPDQRQLLDFLAKSGEATKTQIMHDCFKRNRSAKAIEYDLTVLKSQDRVYERNMDGVTY